MAIFMLIHTLFVHVYLRAGYCEGCHNKQGNVDVSFSDWFLFPCIYLVVWIAGSQAGFATPLYCFL